MSEDCFVELVQSFNHKLPVLYEKQKMSQKQRGTDCSLHIVHHTHTRTCIRTPTDYFRCRPFQVSIFVFIRFSLSYFKSSVQCCYSVTAFHIHPQSTAELLSKLFSSGRKKNRVNTFIPDMEQHTEMKLLSLKSFY